MKRRVLNVAKISALILSPIFLLLGVVVLSGLSRPKPPPSGVIPFSPQRPEFSLSQSDAPAPSPSSLERFQVSMDELRTWDKNPWQSSYRYLGDHFFKLESSTDPADIEKLAQIRARAKELSERVLARYPELAVTYKDVPDEENGFLQWLDFMERYSDTLEKGLHLPY